jgi:hypothetical protein
MFEWLRKTKTRTLLDDFVTAMYGDPPPPKSANVETAVQLAHREMLGCLISEQEIRELASALYEGPIPYTTHHLALSVALNFFRRPEQLNHLHIVQLRARLIALDWAKEKKIPMHLLSTFEESLYERYKQCAPLDV